MNIIYYGSYLTTDGKEYLVGYEESNKNIGTGDIIVKEIEKEEINYAGTLYGYLE